MNLLVLFANEKVCTEFRHAKINTNSPDIDRSLLISHRIGSSLRNERIRNRAFSTNLWNVFNKEACEERGKRLKDELNRGYFDDWTGK